MNPYSPSAYFLSALVHASAIALLFLASFVMRQTTREPARIIELVAGEGDNWAATEAPALGSETGDPAIKMPQVSIPEPPAKVAEPEPSPVQPVVEPSPIQPAPVEKPEPVKKAEKPVPTKQSPLDQKKTTFSQDIKRLADKRETRRLKEHRAKQAAEAKKQAMMSKAEFDRMNAPKGGAKGGIKRVDAKGIAGGVAGGSTANTKGGAGGKALTAAETSQLDRYFEYLKRAIKRSHVAPPGITDLTTVVQFMVGADGKVSNVRVVGSSGNGEFDQSVLEAIRRTPSVGMRPDGKTDMVEMEFSAKDE